MAAPSAAQLPRWADETSRQRLALEHQAAALATQVLQAGPQPTPVEQLIAMSPPAGPGLGAPQPVLPVAEPEPWPDELALVTPPAGIRRTPSIWRIMQAIERARALAT